MALLGPGVVSHRRGGDKVALPSPDAVAQQHSAAVAERLRAAIAAAGGVLSFAEYMQLALYAPGLGYYMAGQPRFGAGGDFITAPEMGEVFGGVLARAIAPYLGPDGILEFGGGSGALAAQLQRRLPGTPYGVLELSPSLQQAQQQASPGLRHWQELPALWRGVILANEVLDALPVTVVEKGEDGLLRELGVVCTETGFTWQAAVEPLSAEKIAEIAPYWRSWPVGYRTELHPQGAGWLRSVALRLQQGAIVLIDYGQEGREYYHPQRSMGSLRAYYRHHVLDDPFLWPGLCDLTAHVNFSLLLEEAMAAGLQVAWYGNLARFLIEHGLPELYAELAAQADEQQRLALNNEVKRLTLPQEMGESFKVLILSR